MDAYNPRYLQRGEADTDETTQVEHAQPHTSTTTQEIARRALIPEFTLPPPESIGSPNDDIANFLKNRIIGQDAAVDAIVAALDRRHARVDERPIASLLFLGPTGVGKTETVKALLSAFDDRGMESNLVTVDCASLSSQHDAPAYLLGSPPGYVGYNDPPAFDPNNFATPYEEKITILLLDEIEKAANDLYKTLLPVLDEGRAILKNGAETSFANTIIIATSNVGAEEMGRLMAQRVGFETSKTPTRSHDVGVITAAALRGLKEHFKTMPEFIGRFGEPIVFKPHDENSLHLVLNSALERRNDDLRGRFGVEVTVSPIARGTLVTEALPQSNLGARPLIHALENRVWSAMGRYMSMGYLPEGYRLRVHHSSELGGTDDNLIFSSELDESLLIEEVYSVEDKRESASEAADDDDGDNGDEATPPHSENILSVVT